MSSCIHKQTPILFCVSLDLWHLAQHTSISPRPCFIHENNQLFGLFQAFIPLKLKKDINRTDTQTETDFEINRISRPKQLCRRHNASDMCLKYLNKVNMCSLMQIFSYLLFCLCIKLSSDSPHVEKTRKGFRCREKLKTLERAATHRSDGLNLHSMDQWTRRTGRMVICHHP